MHAFPRTELGCSRVWVVVAALAMCSAAAAAAAVPWSATFSADTARGLLNLTVMQPGAASLRLTLSAENGAIVGGSAGSIAAPLVGSSREAAAEARGAAEPDPNVATENGIGVWTRGSHNGCLWGFVGSTGGSYVGGCSYSTAAFSYAWSAGNSSLTLYYGLGAVERFGSRDGASVDSASELLPAVRVDICVVDVTALDFSMHVLNGSWTDGGVLQTTKEVLFPSELLLPLAPRLAGVSLPLRLPGVTLLPPFFNSGKSATADYPGRGAAADFVHWSVDAGNPLGAGVAVYALPGGGPNSEAWLQPAPVHLGVASTNGSPGGYFSLRRFKTWLEPSAMWSSPPVRTRVGATLMQAIASWQVDTGATQEAGLRTVASKLASASRSSVAQRFAQSVLVKADVVHMGLSFSSWVSKVLPQLPSPSLLHVVGFEPNGFDRHYPDFLPPAAQFGTTEQLADMFRAAQASGLIVMPYTNPTWWCTDAPTLAHLPSGTTLLNVSVLNSTGQPVYEQYDDGKNGGYVASRCSEFVRWRLERLAHNMTVTVPSDILFEDQIGARPWLLDFNTACPDVTGYIHSWLNHTRTLSAAGTLLGTEQGFDRAAAFELSFYGSVLADWQAGAASSLWGAMGTHWRPTPLASAMLREFATFSQHDLGGPWTTSLRALSFNLAFGYGLSVDLGSFPSPMPPDLLQWLRIAVLIQRVVVADIMAAPVVAFSWAGDSNVSASAFRRGWVVSVNWATVAESTVPVNCSSASATIAAGGFAACNLTTSAFVADGSYNGAALSEGVHLLVEQRGDSRLRLTHVNGTNTTVAVNSMPEWSKAAQVPVLACASDGSVVSRLSLPIEGKQVSVHCTSDVASYLLGPLGSRACREWPT